ncbi:hypothetical protein K435DRAFT_710411 [Dendrothele bispora CBS 962.96]|uniref:Oxidase ustYa n=1 Tax=Dendrothele bispora (strain CBS 962.96) TaxID=1314807 RepID=A0A4S8MWI5_DENBC|nr:hypothetical protein K435DRAFT_710411 [Dendrothele bispora CBS 962.96]
MTSLQNHWRNVSWLLIAGLNIILLLSRLHTALPTQHKFSYIGDDYPIELPFAQSLHFVTMTLHESTHYDLLNPNTSDPVLARISDTEWQSTITNPLGMGRVHLGDNHRLFTATFWHQIHCVREMARAIVDPDHPEATPGHIEHCLGYLRQGFLCEAEYGLEAGDFMKRDFVTEPIADTVVCRDWEGAFKYLEEQTEEWVRWKRAHGV